MFKFLLKISNFVVACQEPLHTSWVFVGDKKSSISWQKTG